MCIDSNPVTVPTAPSSWPSPGWAWLMSRKTAFWLSLSAWQFFQSTLLVFAYGHWPGGLFGAPGIRRVIPEMRGHGLSRRNQQYARNRVADYARYDLPAIGAFVREQSAQVPHWVGHSLGATTLAAALGKHLGALAAGLGGLAGCQVSRTHWPLKIPLGDVTVAACSANCWAGGPGAWPRRGPEDEPAGVMIEAVRWYRPVWTLWRWRQDW